MAHDFHEIEKRWERGWDCLYIVTGQALRQVLIERLGENLLNAYSAHMWVKDAPLQSGHVMVTLRVSGRSFDLRNIRYTEAPAWSLSGHTRSGKWRSIELPDEQLRSHLEGLLQLLDPYMPEQEKE